MANLSVVVTKTGHDIVQVAIVDGTIIVAEVVGDRAADIARARAMAAGPRLLAAVERVHRASIGEVNASLAAEHADWPHRPDPIAVALDTARDELAAAWQEVHDVIAATKEVAD